MDPMKSVEIANLLKGGVVCGPLYLTWMNLYHIVDT